MKQPFLLSLQREAGQMGDLESFRTLLSNQQNAFKDYLHERCHSETSVAKRYEFRKTAEYAINNIRLMFADKIRKIDADFYLFWSKLTHDTQQYISIGILVLRTKYE